MSRNIAFTILGIIVLGFIAIIALKPLRPSSIMPIPPGANKNETASRSLRPDNIKIIELPISLTSPNVGQVLVHYFLTGTIKKLENSTEGTQIIVDTKDQSIPKITLTNQTRISKIAPPYSAETSLPLRISDLKAGVNIDISAEYDLREKIWIIRDVFVPTDRNP